MAGKPVLTINSRTVINMNSGFKDKKLCDGPTFSTGEACVFKCSFCFVKSVMNQRMVMLKRAGAIPEDTKHTDVVIRRLNALEIMRQQLTHPNGKPKYADPADKRVIYASPLVDVAANMELVYETIAACKIILELTHWHIRLLSKSSFLPIIAKALVEHKGRMLFGVSTGEISDALAAAYEQGTHPVSKRLASLRWLQDNGFRTYGMICPSLPRDGEYSLWAESLAKAIRVDRCEEVFAEVINGRGDSMQNTADALRKADFRFEAVQMEKVTANKETWELEAQRTFLAHRRFIPDEKLRFLQYVTKANRSYWENQASNGAVLL